MAIAALNSAATGLRALSTRIDVIANNLANAETNAFKRQRVNFEDLYYSALRQPGINSGGEDLSPAGIFVGSGVKVSNTQLDTEQGPMEVTNRSLDVAIEGPGFFKVKVLDTIGDGFAYTRNGNFFVNKNRELVLGLGDGYRIQPVITLPQNVTEKDVSISEQGVVNCKLPGGGTTTVGQLQLTNFINPQGLELMGGSLYRATEASGQPVTGNPGENGTGIIRSGTLEGSNVDPVKELVTLIKTQRSFELNSQSIQTADQALQTIANLRRA
jgi:flagellar basal-body rod protein FlgG